MNFFYRITFVACILQCLFLIKAWGAANTYDWTGATNSNWATPGNWKVNGVTQTTNYPGVSSTDIAQIGVTYSFTNQPAIPAATTIATLTIGTKTSSVTLTINAALVVNGDFTQKNDGTGNGVTTSITGTGSMYCTNFYLGDSTTPPAPLVSLANATYKTILNFSLSGLTVGQDLVLTTTSSYALISLLYPSANVNNAIFNLNSGWVSVGNTIQTIDSNDENLPGFLLWAAVSNSAQFLMNPASGNSSIIYFNGANPLNLDGHAGYVDFYGNAGGTSQVNYSGGGNQEVYTTSSAYNAAGTRQYANGLDRSPSVYQDLVFSGSLTKKADAGNLSIGHDFILSVSSTPVADFATNSPVVTIGGNYTANVNTTLNQGGSGTMSVTGSSSNAGTLNQTGSGNITFTSALSNLATGVISQSSTGAITASCCFTNAGSYTQTSGSTGGMAIAGNLNNSGTIAQTAGNLSAGGNVTNSGTLTLGTANLTIGGNYNNSGTYTQSTGTTFFNGSLAETLQDVSSNGTNFNSVTFTGGGTKTMSSGTFTVSSASVLTMAGGSSLAAGGNLTLKSDASGTAAVAAIPSGCSITGTINIQRYLSASRGYRLLSSPVYTVTSGSINNLSLAYLDADATVGATTYHGAFTGGPGTGFSFYNGNPTIYLYNETLPISNAYYTSGKHVGVSSITGNTVTTVSLATGTVVYTPGVSIPVGNGFLMYFVGPNTRTTPSSSIPPTNATLTASGTLNQGDVPVNLWYTASGGAGHLSYTSTLTSAQGGPGYNMVGNPYASTIDLYKVLSNNSGIDAIYTLSPIGPSQAYAVYTQSGSSAPATYYAVSGQGLIVHGTSANATLTFHESDKSATTQLTGTQLLMGTPKQEAALTGLYLKLEKDSLHYDYCGIYFRNDWSDAYENGDALYFGGNSINMASLSSDGKMAAVNHLHTYTNDNRIRLYTNAQSGGSYTLKIEGIRNIDTTYDIYLVDQYKKDSVNIRKTGAYAFSIIKSDTASFGANRFVLAIRKNPDYAYQLLEFSAQQVAHSPHVLLTWKTQNELNNNFTVERSNDGGNTFAIAGGLHGTGAGNYSLKDKNAMDGQNLYRLKSEDINNKLNYSQIVEVMISGNGNAGKIRLYPNPATSTVNLDVLDKTNANASYTIIVSNSTGIIVKQTTSSQPNWQANISDLLAGTYLVRVLNNKTQTFVGESKFVKL